MVALITTLSSIIGTAFVAAVSVLIRATMMQVKATKDNTTQTKANTVALNSLVVKVDNHETRISWTEGMLHKERT